MKFPGKKPKRSSGCNDKVHGGSFEKSKRAILLKVIVSILIFALLCALPVFINDPVGYLPALTYVFLFLFSLVYVNVLAARIDCGLLANMHSCPRNTNINFRLRFRNRSWLPCVGLQARFVVTDIFEGTDIFTDLNISVKSKAMRDFDLPVRFAHIGTCKVGLSQVCVSDLLGLFIKNITVPAMEALEITPRLFDVDQSAIRSLELNETKESMTPFQKDGMDYMGVREYKIGDPMKAIHWKLSSRGIDTLYTKLYETSGTPGMEILLSTHAPSLSHEDLAALYDTCIEAAVSFHDFALRNNLRTRLVIEDKHGGRAYYGDEERIDYRDMLDKLPLPGPDNGITLVSDELHSLMMQQDAPGNVVIITSYLSEETVVAMLDARSRGKQLLCVLITPTKIPADARYEINGIVQRLAQAGIGAVEINDSEEIERLIFG